MQTNIVISLDTRRNKKDGSFPLVMRLGHNRRTIAIPIGISLQKQDWDKKNRIVRKSYQGVSTINRLNNLIQKKRADAMDIIMKLHESDELDRLSVSDLKSRIYVPASSQSFFQFTSHLILELEKSERFGTARSYRDVMNVLKKFANTTDLPFRSINYQFLSQFETDHLSKGNSANGLSVYIRAIRAIYNKAIKSGIVEKDLYPFESYKIKSIPTEKRALEWDALKKIIHLEISADHPCF
ncbi:MAG TPA: phage integrase SAM-like domain and Arm DNA-binding domain-containing protein, partial [Chitinophagales bacterium]|nr:phage integrase SAM-like domain and Arm DNA-binding domain-containing protein [Chitinophagales bacterium]